MCALFGESRDISLFRHVSREIINQIIEQKVGYYQIVLDKTTSNIYGEANGTKTYNDPVLINCLISRSPQVSSTDDFGPDINRDVQFRFLRQDLKDVNTFPEVGDIILWHEDYYEVDNTTENQLFLGIDENYNFNSMILLLLKGVIAGVLFYGARRLVINN
jgi:hypothetical protein